MRLNRFIWIYLIFWVCFEPNIVFSSHSSEESDSSESYEIDEGDDSSRSSRTQHAEIGRQSSKKTKKCEWDKCSKSFHGLHAEKERYEHWRDEHLTNVTLGTKTVQCKWKGCGIKHNPEGKGSTKEWLRNHCPKKHLEYKPFTCNICSRAYSTRPALKFHSRYNDHKGKSVPTVTEISCEYGECAKNPEDFSSQEACWEHFQESHLAPKSDGNYRTIFLDLTQCAWNNCTYKVRASLVSSGDKKAALISHILSKHLKGYRAFKCQVDGCDRGYSRLVGLRRHEKDHKKQRSSPKSKTKKKEAPTSKGKKATEQPSEESEPESSEPLSESENDEDNVDYEPVSSKKLISKTSAKKRKRDQMSSLSSAEPEDGESEETDNTTRRKKKKTKTVQSNTDSRGPNTHKVITIDTDDEKDSAETKEAITTSMPTQKANPEAKSSHATAAVPANTRTSYCCPWNGCWMACPDISSLKKHFDDAHYLVCDKCSDGPFLDEDAFIRHIDRCVISSE